MWERQLAYCGVRLGGSASTQDAVRQIQALAQSNTPVLLEGETGTGKRWIAQLLHALSARSRAPFLEVHCAALTASFLDTRLFGYEGGTAGNARSDTPGLLELACRGTLFLCDIGALAPELQPKLLKAVQDRRSRRLGGTREIELDVRPIAATSHDLGGAVRAGCFRVDLFDRLAPATVRLPPLRERGRASIAGMAAEFMAELARRFQHGGAHLAPATIDLLARYTWPGNVRELRDVLEQAVLVSGTGKVIRPEHLPRELRARVTRSDDDLRLTLTELERRHIERVLRSTSGNRTEAARILGISRVGLYKKLQRYEDVADDEAAGGSGRGDPGG